MSEELSEDEKYLDPEPPPYGTWIEMWSRVTVQGKAMEGMRKELKEMSEEMARQKEKIEVLTRVVGKKEESEDVSKSLRGKDGE